MPAPIRSIGPLEGDPRGSIVDVANESRTRASKRSVKRLSVALALAALLSSCDVPARITQGPVTSWIPPNAGPELVAVPVGNLNVVMEPGLASQEDADAALSPVRGYVLEAESTWQPTRALPELTSTASLRSTPPSGRVQMAP